MSQYDPPKTKKIIKKALKNPELYTDSEIQYFELVKRTRKSEKKRRKMEKEEKSNNSDQQS